MLRAVLDICRADPDFDQIKNYIFIQLRQIVNHLRRLPFKSVELCIKILVDPS